MFGFIKTMFKKTIGKLFTRIRNQVIIFKERKALALFNIQPVIDNNYSVSYNIFNAFFGSPIRIPYSLSAYKIIPKDSVSKNNIEQAERLVNEYGFTFIITECTDNNNLTVILNPNQLISNFLFNKATNNKHDNPLFILKSIGGNVKHYLANF